MRRPVLSFWILFGTTLFLYLLMVAWSLPRIAGEAGGLMPFDLRPSGYSFEEARAFLAALSPDGSAFYLDVQHRLDLFYPALLAATLALAIWLLVPPSLRHWRLALAALAFPGMVFDYLENAAVAGLLRAGPDAVVNGMVADASRWTVLKSTFTTLALVLVLALVAAWFARRRKKPVGLG